MKNQTQLSVVQCSASNAWHPSHRGHLLTLGDCFFSSRTPNRVTTGGYELPTTGEGVAQVERQPRLLNKRASVALLANAHGCNRAPREKGSVGRATTARVCSKCIPRLSHRRVVRHI